MPLSARMRWSRIHRPPILIEVDRVRLPGNYVGEDQNANKDDADEYEDIHQGRTLLDWWRCGFNKGTHRHLLPCAFETPSHYGDLSKGMMNVSGNFCCSAPTFTIRSK